MTSRGFYQALRIFTTACACTCPSHRLRSDLRSASPRCRTRLPASQAGRLCFACAEIHAACAGGCDHKPVWRA